MRPATSAFRVTDEEKAAILNARAAKGGGTSSGTIGTGPDVVADQPAQPVAELPKPEAKQETYIDMTEELAPIHKKLDDGLKIGMGSYRLLQRVDENVTTIGSYLQEKESSHKGLRLPIWVWLVLAAVVVVVAILVAVNPFHWAFK